MNSSGSVERTSRLRFALQTPARLLAAEDSDEIVDRLERVETSARKRSDRLAEEAKTSDQIVLLIEDNLEIVSAIAHCLHGAGYQTQCAADVEDAINKVRSRAVSLVLLNWGLLLRIGGRELIGELRNSSPRSRLPMVVISDEVSALNEASSLGIEDYVLDPFQFEDLLHLVDEYCG